MRNLGIGLKLSLVVGIVTLAVFSGVIWYSATTLEKTARSRVYDAAKAEGEADAALVKAALSEPMHAANTLADLMEGIKESGLSRNDTMRVLRGMLENNPQYFAVWFGFKENAFDNHDDFNMGVTGSDDDGRFMPRATRQNGEIVIDALPSADKPGAGKLYAATLAAGHETLSEPYQVTQGGKTVTLISLCSPILDKGKIVGVAGVDIDEANLSKLVLGLKPFEKGYAFLFSNDAVYVAHPKAEFVGKGVLEVRKDATARVEAIKKGTVRTEENKSLATGARSYYVLTPFTVDGTDTPWSLAISVPMDDLMAEAEASVRTSFLIGGGAVLLLLIVVFAVSRRLVSKPLGSIVTAARAFAEGDFNRRLEVASRDEVGTAARYLNEAFDIVVEKTFWYESILDSISFPISVTDNDLNWTFLNKAAEKATGLTRAQIAGKQCREWDTEICGTERCAAECMKRGQSTTDFAQNGLEYQANSSFLYDRSGEKIGFIEVLQDVTEAKAMRRKADAAVKEGMLAAAGRLEGIVGRITTAAEELSSQTEQITRGTEQQKGRMAETATAMEEMNATVMEVARNASEAAGGADQAKQKALEGAEIVTRVVTTMDEVKSKSASMNDNLGQLGKQAESIGLIINVINDIADQTNLLALNAAIEAARAGDAGRGFAVVADEVRKLAEKTMGATKEVAENIRGIQEAAKRNVSDMGRTVEVVDKAAALSGESGTALGEIVGLVETSALQIQSIASAAEQQSAASEEISQSIDEVNRVASETAEGMARSERAVSELADMASELGDLIGELKAG
ncbi:methyl-accepting chemotaxis sensory transducer with Cache sensor [Desulfovibrio sp. X2]|uniref:methyl-accepting chemotaxis protein n=1 Tax=Desulfovibrio sp. X2 TaxID=941449 RepID=UPI0003589E9C|nr:methyl-accepting chemotaxis protein [Desulfovibrio sp. X2]EPR40864.1 methyl-accepting chemotaxis sensory transducer with Cache sensor [Desulfovibrio sp. X2]